MKTIIVFWMLIVLLNISQSREDPEIKDEFSAVLKSIRDRTPCGISMRCSRRRRSSRSRAVAHVVDIMVRMIFYFFVRACSLVIFRVVVTGIAQAVVS